MQPKTMLVKPWGEEQGDHVVINVDDFDPNFHTPLEGAEKTAGGEGGTAPQNLTAAQLKEALTAKGIEFKGNASKAELQALLEGAEKTAE